MTKTPNHALSAMHCPVHLRDVDLFAPGAQEHWYEAYEILHREAPVLRLPGEGPTPGSDGFILTKYADIAPVVRDPVRFPPTLSLAVDQLKQSGLPPEQLPQTNAMIASMLTLRPTIELWRAHRQELTDPWVGPGADRHTAMITRCVDELIDAWIDRGEVEFISEFARPLPQRVMANVLGFPARGHSATRRVGHRAGEGVRVRPRPPQPADEGADHRTVHSCSTASRST